MKLTINPILRSSLELLVLACLIFLLIKGCQHGRTQQELLTSNKQHYDSLSNIIVKAKQDSIANANEFNTKIGLITTQYENLQEQKNEVDVQSDKLKDENKQLIAKYKAGYKDTNNVVCPQEFINDCKDCFTNLEKLDSFVAKCRRNSKASDSLWLEKVTVYNKQLKKVQDQNSLLSATLQDCINTGKATDKKLTPRGKMLMSLGALFNTLLPKGVGAGLIYQDKRGRQFGVMYYGTNYGPIQILHLDLPLSFKK